MATFNRAHLLWRSLVCYRTHEFDNRELELVVIDDSSTDNTQQLVRDWSAASGIRTVVLSPYPKIRDWRDCGAVLNYGIRASSGKHVLLTHPEVIPGRRSVAWCVDQLDLFAQTRSPLNPNFGAYACSKVYYMSPRDQERIDLVDWNKDALAVRQIEGFYDEDFAGNPDYTHAMTDRIGTHPCRIKTWESWVFGGCSRETWKKLGGMLETSEWGSVDIAFMERRRVLGIPNSTGNDPDTIVVHQNHDVESAGNIPTPRDMDVWKKELAAFDLKSPDRLCYPYVDNL
jgi:glycosyltransferase involved in cell wall biosynthesis